MRVRVAGDEDVGTLRALRRAWNAEVAGAPVDDEHFDAAFARWFDAERATRTFFLVERDGEAIGMANVKRYERMPTVGRPAGSWGYLANVFVRADHRNAGVGEVLLRAVCAWAWAEGLEHLRVAPSPRSWSFYRRLGFDTGALAQLDPPSG